MPIVVGGIVTVIVAWFLLDAFLHFRKEPIMLAIPVSCDNLDDSHISFSVPQGRYYMQIAFEEESLSLFHDSRISGLIILETGKDQYHYDVNLDFSMEFIQNLIDTSRRDAEIALLSRRKNKVLPWPWTTIVPQMASIPLFPPFTVSSSGEILRLHLHLELQQPGADRVISALSCMFFIRVDTFIDAI